MQRNIVKYPRVSEVAQDPHLLPQTDSYVGIHEGETHLLTTVTSDRLTALLQPKLVQHRSQLASGGGEGQMKLHTAFKLRSSSVSTALCESPGDSPVQMPFPIGGNVV